MVLNHAQEHLLPLKNGRIRLLLQRNAAGTSIVVRTLSSLVRLLESIGQLILRTRLLRPRRLRRPFRPHAKIVKFIVRSAAIVDRGRLLRERKWGINLLIVFCQLR